MTNNDEIIREEDEDLLTWGNSVSKLYFVFCVLCLKEEDED